MSLLPPLGSFSTSLRPSRAWRAFLARPPAPLLQWEGELPLLLRMPQILRMVDTPTGDLEGGEIVRTERGQQFDYLMYM